MSKKNGNNNSVGLDIGTLSGHLWKAANTLRGPVDAADFKTYGGADLFGSHGLITSQTLVSNGAGFSKTK